MREPEGNGVAERFIRTLKENVLWVRSFDTIEELRLALLEFKRTYNEHWMLERYPATTEAPLRYGATSSGWTRQRRSEYRQTTVQEPWGDTRSVEGRKFESCRARHFLKEFGDSGLCRVPGGEGSGEKSDRSALQDAVANPVVPPVCGGRWSSSRRATAVVGASRLVSSETNPTRPEWTEYTVVPQSTFHTSVIRF